jgi:hypothetical protein
LRNNSQFLLVGKWSFRAGRLMLEEIDGCVDDADTHAFQGRDRKLP